MLSRPVAGAADFAAIGAVFVEPATELCLAAIGLDMGPAFEAGPGGRLAQKACEIGTGPEEEAVIGAEADCRLASHIAEDANRRGSKRMHTGGNTLLPLIRKAAIN
jgi:hypothetical protein